MLDEAAKRKPNFDERNSAPVVLADGQTWWVPKPWLEIRPVFRGGKAVTAYPVLTCGPELDGLIEAMADCEDRRAGHRRGFAGGSPAVLALRADRRRAGRAAGISGGRRRSVDWLREVFAVATGRSGPKVYSAGGD